MTDNPARQGRFAAGTDPVLHAANQSTHDRRLWRQDIRGSRAHARMLAGVGLISQADHAAIAKGLGQVEGEFARGEFAFHPEDEDIHMAVERRLTEIVGEPGQRLHTGRSRNDQVMTDLLLWLCDSLPELAALLRAWGLAHLKGAAEHTKTPMPALTHLQPAQVASVAHWHISHAAGAERNLRRLNDLLARLDECPLGSGAVAGCSLPLDRQAVATDLGFSRPAQSALQATGGRADVLDTLALLGIIGTDLSRLGEDLALFCSPLLGWAALPDSLTTGSSLLPHKVNPDGAEILRGQGRLLASSFSALAAVVGGLPSGYSKDLQADKEVLFTAWDKALTLLPLATAQVAALSWDKPALAAACPEALAAPFLADTLVKAGIPFRHAHDLVGQAVAKASPGALAPALAAILAASGDHAGAEAVCALPPLTPLYLLEQTTTEGGAGPAQAKAAITLLGQRLTGE
ncbi:argininosuccinate lyase [bacterium]|nr:argininosuccinate lyase [bacterium]